MPVVLTAELLDLSAVEVTAADGQAVVHDQNGGTP
jgi:hypothetical protein